MHIAVIGGGPAGLFFARKVKQFKPDWRIQVYEQNARDATYGFGVGLLGQSLKFINSADPELLTAIRAVAQSTSAMGFVHNGETAVVNIGPDGESVAIERIRLLQILQRLCENVGVELQFDTCIEDTESIRREVDVLVGADGVNSGVRACYWREFETSVVPQRNRFAWYATERIFNPPLMIFEQTGRGLLIAHAYQYRPDRSGFAVECDPEIWERAEFAQMAPEALDATFHDIFAKHLRGKRLLSGTVRIFRPAIVKNKNWSYRNVVLIGDAVHTVHPSIGSGTRVGLRDASVLAEAFASHGADLARVFRTYRERRRSGSDLFQRAAIQSIKWYESLGARMHFDAVTMAFSYMLRTGRVDYARLRQADPDFVRRYESAPLPWAGTVGAG